VKTEEFESLREGLDPHTGEFLRQRHSADRKASDGTTQSRGRSLYDFTISAPKSISIMAILGGDCRLVACHEKAVSEALQELERAAASRVRRSGANTDRLTGNLAIAVYHHDTSRELDPQLHTHAVATNLTYDGTEGCWKALQATGIYKRRAYMTEVYRSSLAWEVRSLGYEIEDRRDGKGNDNGFEIRGVSNDLLRKFSQRSRQRDEAITGFKAEKGRQPTDKEVAVLVRESRADKLVEISTERLRTRQLDRLTPEEIRQMAELRAKATSKPIAIQSPERSLEFAKDHVFERVSVSGDYEILTEALRHGRGQISHSDLKGALAFQETCGEILRNGNDIATTKSLERERAMIESVNRSIGAFEPLAGANGFTPSDRLSPEQKHVVDFVLRSRDGVVNISGAAGTGKTATLQELQRGLSESGRQVLAAAPTVSSVEELQGVGFSNAVTLERLLQDRDAQSSLAGQVLILDEAGMVSGRQMAEMLRVAKQNSIRVVFSGDTQQIQSVESCNALRVLEKESRLKTVALTQVRRQTEERYKDAVQELRRNPELGFEKLDAIGAVHEVAWLDRPQIVANAFFELRRKGQDPLVVCPTHEEIDRVTEAIRSLRKASGEVRESFQLTRDVSLNWTVAQKRDLRNFHAGQILGFHRAVKGIAKDETAEVVSTDGTSVTLRNDRGEIRKITGKQAKSFDVYERRIVDIVVGDKLMLTANRRQPGFRTTNGEIVTVERIDNRGRVHLKDGRVLPTNFGQFDHGYAVTAHRSQDKSVDSVIISADGMQRELFYVAASRGRESAVIITSKKGLLLESIGRSAVRQSATELVRKQRPGLHQGVHRGLAAARKLAASAAQHLSSIFPRPQSQMIHEVVIKPARVKERSHDHGLSR
jgi:conjugative relaxase-like TrwC/TraI family protein